MITYKVQSKDLALDLWGQDENGHTWEYIYFIDELKNINIPLREFNEVVGYKPNYPVYGFSVLNDVKTGKALEHFEFISESHF